MMYGVAPSHGDRDDGQPAWISYYSMQHLKTPLPNIALHSSVSAHSNPKA